LKRAGAIDRIRALTRIHGALRWLLIPTAVVVVVLTGYLRKRSSDAEQRERGHNTLRF
jgi:hypothetical protein